MPCIEDKGKEAAPQQEWKKSRGTHIVLARDVLQSGAAVAMLVDPVWAGDMCTDVCYRTSLLRLQHGLSVNVPALFLCLVP